MSGLDPCQSTRMIYIMCPQRACGVGYFLVGKKMFEMTSLYFAVNYIYIYFASWLKRPNSVSCQVISIESFLERFKATGF